MTRRPPTRRRRPADPTRLADLRLDPTNRRSHNERNLGMVTAALQEVGAARSIVIDEDNLVLAGNGLTEAARAAGFNKLRVVDADGQTVIAVRRTGLTAAQKRALAIYDNRAAELAEWNQAQLAADLANGEDLTAFFLPDELSALLPAQGKPGLTDPDDVPAMRPTDIALGDVFALGRHRLVCGDATQAATVARALGGAKPALMVTDPPYGVNYDATWRGKALPDRAGRAVAPVLNDDRADWSAAWTLFPGDVAYVWHGGTKASIVFDSLERCGFLIRSQIIWAKSRLVISRGHYHPKHEPCWYAVRKNAKSDWAGDHAQTTLWEITHLKSDTGHSTQKPVECMRRPIANHRAVSVYEPFAGSGTTVIAAEQLGRACYAIELHPPYVQVIIDRWEAFTGQTATKVAGR